MTADINIPTLGLVLLVILFVGMSMPAFWWFVPLAIGMIVILVLGEASGGKIFQT